MPVVQYPYDPDGNSPTNLVQNEEQILTQINSDPFRYFIPDFAPFYQTNFSLLGKNALGNTVILTNGVDYQFSMKYIGASRANGMMIFGAITIINKDIQGEVTVTYQCLGGQYSANRNFVVETIAANNYNPRRIAWDQVTNVPAVFPPSRHPENIDTFTGFRDLIDAIDRVATQAAIVPQPLRDALWNHILDYNDPHQTMAIVQKFLDDNGYKPGGGGGGDGGDTDWNVGPPTIEGLVPINAPVADDRLGRCVAVNETGEWIAISPRAGLGWVDIYQRVQGVTTFRQRITRPATGFTGTVDYGASMAFSSTDGTIGFPRIFLAISWPSGYPTAGGTDASGNAYSIGQANDGVVQLHRLNNGATATNTWSPYGYLITNTGQVTNAKFGRGLDFTKSPTGEILYVGTEMTNRVLSYSFVNVLGSIVTEITRSELTAPAGLTSISMFGYSISTSQDGKFVAIGSPGYNANKGRIYIYDTSNVLLGFTESSEATQLGKIMSISSTGKVIAGSDPGNNTIYLFEAPASGWTNSSPTPVVYKPTPEAVGAPIVNFGKSITKISGASRFFVGTDVSFEGEATSGRVIALRKKSTDTPWLYDYTLTAPRVPITVTGSNKAAAGISTFTIDGSSEPLALNDFSFSLPVTVNAASFSIQGGKGSQTFIPATPGGWSNFTFTRSIVAEGATFRAIYTIRAGSQIDSVSTCDTDPEPPSGWVTYSRQTSISDTPMTIVRKRTTVNSDIIFQNISNPFLKVYLVVTNETNTHIYTYPQDAYYQKNKGPDSTLTVNGRTYTAEGGLGPVVGDTVTGNIDLLKNGIYGNFVTASKDFSVVAVAEPEYSSPSLSKIGGVYLYSQKPEGLAK